MTSPNITSIQPLGFPWKTQDPFLFCVYHADNYPEGNEEMGPTGSLAGRNIGQDFTLKDGWRMYHGQQVPGFPQHPHRGFETITIVKKGWVDHTDSMGAAGRFGDGDVQWMTAGKGVLHSEMFPLLKQEERNPLVLFQIWLNLPAKNKFVPPHFKMLWGESIPGYEHVDTAGKKTIVDVVAGEIEGTKALSPTPSSWAANPANEVGIWIIQMEPEALWQLPMASADVHRSLYFFEGDGFKVDGVELETEQGAELKPGAVVSLENGKSPAQLLLLQGKPIEEPVAQHGPFVMNTQQEIQEAFLDYQKTQFGGWPWPSDDHVHPRDRGRFAKYADGTEETKK